MAGPVPSSPATDDAPHILVVDDDRRIRTLLQRYLQDNGYRVSVAADAAAARALVPSFDFDLLVLDIMMPGEDGLSLAAALRNGATEARRDLPVLLLTARGESEDRIAGLAAGADDYLVKPFEPQELLLRIGAILRRVRAFAPVERAAVTRFGPWVFDHGRGELSCGGEGVYLTSGEAALLKALAGAPGEIFSREALMERLGGGASDARAVDVQMTRLRKKLEDDPRRPRWLRTARGEGYGLWVD